jgi:hypothetical protein
MSTRITINDFPKRMGDRNYRIVYIPDPSNHPQPAQVNANSIQQAWIEFKKLGDWTFADTTVVRRLNEGYNDID